MFTVMSMEALSGDEGIYRQIRNLKKGGNPKIPTQTFSNQLDVALL